MKDKTISLDDRVIIHEDICFQELSDLLSNRRSDILYIEHGVLSICVLEERPYDVVAPAIVFFPPFIELLAMKGKGLRGTLVSFSEESTDDIISSIRDRSEIASTIFVYPSVQLDEQNKHILNNYLLHCRNILLDVNNKDRFLAIKHTTLGFYYSFWAKHVIKDYPVSHINRKLFLQFLTLVKENFRKNRSVSFYSGVLLVSQQHLSRVIKQLSGKTPSEWINKFIIGESKLLLSDNNNSIKEVAFDLGFESISSFSNFFKKQTGISPSEYRKPKEG